MSDVPTYRFTRTSDGESETFTIDASGFTYTRGESIRTRWTSALPDDVIASAIVDLTLSGWIPATTETPGFRPLRTSEERKAQP